MIRLLQLRSKKVKRNSHFSFQTNHKTNSKLEFQQTGDQKLVERLLQLGARIDYVDKKHNLTPLHVAALHRQTEIVKILLAKVNLSV